LAFFWRSFGQYHSSRGHTVPWSARLISFSFLFLFVRVGGPYPLLSPPKREIPHQSQAFEPPGVFG
jgi:hypothetical protein